MTYKCIGMRFSSDPNKLLKVNELFPRCKFAVNQWAELTVWVGWWAHQDLNLGPTDYESAALTN